MYPRSSDRRSSSVSSPWPEPLISICVPTHDGRRDVLCELVEGLIGQVGDVPSRVEICVSDNASCDGTAECIGELSRDCACRLVYRRHPENLGMARNLLAAVALARGTYCWLLGSDDLLAEGALRRACALIDALPEATGYVVGAVHVDAGDPTIRSRALPRAFHPPGDRTRAIEGLDRIYDECGNAWCALSWSVVKRESWLRASQRHEQLLLAHPVFPQVVILAAMAAESPRWGWLAEPLVRQRNATTFLFEQLDAPLADRWTQIIGGVSGAWGAVLGGRTTSRWRGRMRRLHEVWGSAADVRATKLYDSPMLRSQLRLAAACLGAFWPSSNYWREVLSASVMPVWMTRARYGVKGRRWPRRREAERAQLTLRGSLPCRIVAGGVEGVTVEVRNEGRRSILPDGPGVVTIGQRWRTAGQVLGRHELGLNELAALPQSLPHIVRRRNAIRAEVVLYAPVRAGSYRAEVLLHQHGYGWLSHSNGSELIAGDVEVVEP
jgi:glycosyltransferase involved in cell wall biosynthesis